jgi:hypothetical protein
MRTFINLTIRFFFGLIFISFTGCKEDDLEIKKKDDLKIEEKDDLEIKEKDKDNLEIEESVKITVLLLERGDYATFDKTVILYEDENYLIKTPLYHFLCNMDNLLGADYEGDLSTLEKIVFDGKTKDLLYSSLYFGDKTDYVLANFLENGLCYLYDKKNEDNVKQVVIEYWKNSSRAGERKFYINNALFMESVDLSMECRKKEDVKTENREKITVSLIDRDDCVIFDKTVILYEDENYLIKTPLAYFLSKMDRFYFVARYDEHLSTLEKVISDGQTNDLQYSSSYFKVQRIKFVLSGFLESGFCYIYDKKNGNSVKQVVVEYWGYSPAPLAGAGGRRFYINNVLFLETTDWIS